MIENLITDKTILLFDGHCNFCNASMQFVIKHEKENTMYFTSLQSEIGMQILKHFNLNNMDSVVLIENNRFYLQSTAALKITKHLKGLYPILYCFIIVPPFIRNGLYNYFSKNRYKWFGKTESCMVPNEHIKKRFL